MADNMNVGEAVGRALAERGVAHVFGIVGSGNFMVTHGLVDAGVPFTKARHEMGATCMADAYTRVTGRVAVVSVHQGCGLTNTMTGLGEAAKSNTPLLMVSGDSARGDTVGNFAIDQDALVASVGAVPLRIHSAQTAVADAVAAYDLAVRDRVPVVLSLPIDIQDEPSPTGIEVPPPAARAMPAGPAAGAIAKLAAIFAEAERPVILAGRGATHAAADLRDLASRTGAILVPSAGARGLFPNEEWALDVMGGFATPGAKELISEADVLVAFGASLNKWTTHGGSLTGQPVLVQVDDRPEAFGRHHSVTLGIMGDTAEVAAAVTRHLEDGGVSFTGYRTPATAERIRRVRHWAENLPDERDRPGLVAPGALTARLDALLPDERVVVPDGGNVSIYAGSFLRVPDQHGFVMSLAFMSIGLGLAQGVGAAIARRDRLAVVGTGDGAFMMGAVELDTAVREGLGMLVIVYNDDAYGAEVNIFADHPDKHDIVLFPETDLAAVARGYGCEAITVRSLDDLGPLETWLAGPRDRPFLIDAKIAGDPSPISSRAAKH